MDTESEGNSKKVSKKKAAELMLEKLKELPALPPSVIRPRTKISKKKNKNIIKVWAVFRNGLLWILNQLFLSDNIVIGKFKKNILLLLPSKH